MLSLLANIRLGWKGLQGYYSSQHNDIQHNGVICDIQHKNTLRYAECHYAECRDYSIVTISFVILSVIMLNVIMLSVIMLSVVMLSVVMLSVVMLSVILLNVVMLSVVLLNVAMLSVVMLSIVMPCQGQTLLLIINFGIYGCKRFYKIRPWAMSKSTDMSMWPFSCGQC